MRHVLSVFIFFSWWVSFSPEKKKTDFYFVLFLENMNLPGNSLKLRLLLKRFWIFTGSSWFYLRNSILFCYDCCLLALKPQLLKPDYLLTASWASPTNWAASLCLSFVFLKWQPSWCLSAFTARFLVMDLCSWLIWQMSRFLLPVSCEHLSHISYD